MKLLITVLVIGTLGAGAYYVNRDTTEAEAVVALNKYLNSNELDKQVCSQLSSSYQGWPLTIRADGQYTVLNEKVKLDMLSKLGVLSMPKEVSTEDKTDGFSSKKEKAFEYYLVDSNVEKNFRVEDKNLYLCFPANAVSVKKVIFKSDKKGYIAGEPSKFVFNVGYKVTPQAWANSSNFEETFSEFNGMLTNTKPLTTTWLRRVTGQIEIQEIVK